MTPIPVPQRWLIALLGAVFLLDGLLLANGRDAVWALPGAAAMLACVYLAVSRPGLAAAAASVTLLVSSQLMARADAMPVWIGIKHLTLSEVLAGAAIVALLAWRARPAVAVLGTAALVLAALAAFGVRDGRLLDLRSTSAFAHIPEALDLRSFVVGFFLLVIGVAAGVYLRLSGQQRVDSELRTLVRRQWPLAAALTVVLLVDTAAAGGELSYTVGSPQGILESIMLLGAAVAAGCAVIAPRAPVSYALAGAAAIGAVSLPLLFLELATRNVTPLWLPLTQLASSMALVTFVTRFARAEPAGWCIVALAAANGAPLLGSANERENYLLPLVFLLIISVATGMYFRARDRERNQSVRVAVSGAQTAERMALARELHDVVAHHVTGIVVQAQAARLVADGDPTVAVRALEKIENSGTEALTAMRMLVGSLRGAQPAGDSAAASTATSDLAADIRALVDQFPGPTVHLELILPDTLPHEMGRSVLRLVQESLTNVTKHAAGATRVHVGVSTGWGDLGDELHVFVKDDGTARRSNPAGGSGGYGLIGMRERVELLGGWFDAGPSAAGGWLVKVALPLRSTH